MTEKKTEERLTDAHAADRAALVQDRDEWQQVSRDWRYRAETAEADVRQQKEDRAALVAQLEATKAKAEQHGRDACEETAAVIKQRNEAAALATTRFIMLKAETSRSEAAEAQVAELTRERDEARADTTAALEDLATTEESVDELNAEVARLTERLAAEKTNSTDWWQVGWDWRVRAETAEARVRELEAGAQGAIKLLRSNESLKMTRAMQALWRVLERGGECLGPTCPRDGECPTHGRNRPGQTVTRPK